MAHWRLVIDDWLRLFDESGQLVELALITSVLEELLARLSPGDTIEVVGDDATPEHDATPEPPEQPAQYYTDPDRPGRHLVRRYLRLPDPDNPDRWMFKDWLAEVEIDEDGKEIMP
jgi:hypothetical protein